VIVRLPALPILQRSHDLPVWPPLLATRGRGSRSDPHAHHAIHFVLALSGELKVRTSTRGAWVSAAGVLTAPDATHAIDASGVDVMLVFLDPESHAGAALAALSTDPVRTLSDPERTALLRNAEPRALVLGADGEAWTRRAVETLGGTALEPKKAVHPRVRKLLKLLQTSSARKNKPTSLEELSREVGLSEGRLMHVFTSSVGIPLRPYLAWLKLQRAAGAIVTGAPLAEAAHAAGFSDAAHMTRTFRRMFGVAPSALAPGRKAAS
jgi:transcriptional regulator GlxA family with amidase domain